MIVSMQPRHIFVIWAGICGLLILINVLGLLSSWYFGHGLYSIIDLDQEKNIPTFVSSLLLLFNGLLLLFIGIQRRNRNLGNALLWLLLGGIFIFLSMDEFIAFHERLISPVRRMLQTSGFFYYAWVIPYGLLAIILAGAYFRFLMNLPVRTRMLFIYSAALYLSGALGLELLGGYYADLNQGTVGFLYLTLTLCEESLEMIGLCLFCSALADYIDTHLPGSVLTISSQ